MDVVVPWLIFAAVLAVLVGGLLWLAVRARRSGAGRDIMGPVDEIYRPHTHKLNQEIQVQEQRLEAMPSPADPLRPDR